MLLLFSLIELEIGVDYYAWREESVYIIISYVVIMVPKKVFMKSLALFEV